MDIIYLIGIKEMGAPNSKRTKDITKPKANNVIK